MARVTQKDIALKAGLSQMTVSRALRNDPKVKQHTRDKVSRIADELGFVPDPMLTALVTYKRSTQLKVEQKRLALIRSSPGSNGRSFQDQHFNDLLLDGLMRSSELYGFEPRVIEFDTSKTSARTLKSRLIRSKTSAVVWLTPEAGMAFAEPPIDISPYYTVSVGFSFYETPINSVINDWHRAVQLAVRQSIAAGCKRIGMFYSEMQNRRQWREITESYLISRELHPTVEFLDPLNTDALFDRKTGVAEAADWMQQNQPEVVISGAGGRSMLELIRAKTGFGFPADYGFACIDVIDNINPNDSGAVWNRVRTGEIAINQIFSAIRNGQRGIPHTYQRIMVEPKWRDGDSLKTKVC